MHMMIAPCLLEVSRNGHVKLHPSLYENKPNETIWKTISKSIVVAYKPGPKGKPPSQASLTFLLSQEGASDSSPQRNKS